MTAKAPIEPTTYTECTCANVNMLTVSRHEYTRTSAVNIKKQEARSNIDTRISSDNTVLCHTELLRNNYKDNRHESSLNLTVLMIWCIDGDVVGGGCFCLMSLMMIIKFLTFMTVIAPQTFGMMWWWNGKKKTIFNYINFKFVWINQPCVYMCVCLFTISIICGFVFKIKVAIFFF